MTDDLIERLRAYITQREKIRDGGITITECNGVPLTLTDLREAAAALESSRADAARLEDALREAEKDLRQLSVIDCGCKPCRRACRTGKGAEWELERRMKTAHAAANKARAALHPTSAQENDDA